MKIGIDIGLSGGIAIIEGDKLTVHTMPVISVRVRKKMRNQYDIQGIYSILKGCKGEAVIERLRAQPFNGALSAFSMGAGQMLFKTLFTVLGIQYKEVEPRTWQSQVFKSLRIQYNKSTTKEASILSAKQLFPSVSFKATEKCRKDSDGLTDATCIAYWAKTFDK
jgi:hypothetical protein